jgi:deoxyhypusine synthase
MQKAEEQYQTIYKLQPEQVTTPEIKGYDFNQGINYDEILKSYSNFGLQASNFSAAVDIINKMIHWRMGENDENEDPNMRCTIFLGYTSNMVSSGNRDIIRYLAQHKMIDAIVTTAGAIEEDLMKCISTFHKGDW